MARNASPQEKHKSPHLECVFPCFFPLKPIKITGVFKALIHPAMEATPTRGPLRSGRGSIGQISLAALRKDDGDSLYDTLVGYQAILWLIGSGRFGIPWSHDLGKL